MVQSPQVEGFNFPWIRFLTTARRNYLRIGEIKR